MQTEVMIRLVPIMLLPYTQLLSLNQLYCFSTTP